MILLQYRRVELWSLRFILFSWVTWLGSQNLCTCKTKAIYAKNARSFWVGENSTEAPPTIYHCQAGFGNGMGELKAVFSSIFPEYLIVDLSGYVSRHRSYDELNKRGTNANDIFLGLFYPVGCGEPISQWLFLGFKGSIVIHSPESPHTHPDVNGMLKNVHYFGPVKDDIKTEKDHLLTYLQTVWWSDFQKELSVSTLVYGRNHSKENRKPYFMIYAHGNCVKFREIAAWKLSQFGTVHLGGRCGGVSLDGNRTNLVHIETGITLGNWRENTNLYSNYKFCLVMEHERDHSAYITEKILLAFIGGCIPIYHGPPLIFDFFHKHAFIFYNVSDPHEAHTKVQELEADPGLYEAMVNAPILADGEGTLKKYFSFSDSVGEGILKHKIRHLLNSGKKTLN